MDITWTQLLHDQLDWQWREHLRPRLAGITDDEYFWEPVPRCWSVRPRGTSSAPITAGSGPVTIDFAIPEPVPAPVTTIAWRLGHIIVGVLGERAASHFGGPPVAYETFDYAASADAALAQLDEAYRHWSAGVQALTPEALGAAVGPAEGPFAEHPMAELVLHINREVLHHGAEVAVLRDLYAHRT